MAKTFQSSLKEQSNKLTTALDSIQSFCSKVSKVNYDTEIYVKKYGERNVFETDGSITVDHYVYYSPDYRAEWKKFNSCISNINQACSNIRSGGLAKLSKLSLAIKSINALIDEFDRADGFTLADAFAENSNVKVEVDEETQQEKIYFVDADGNEIPMSDLLNSFYTY